MVEWVLGTGPERERKVGNCTREKVCPRSEWEGRGHGEVWQGRCGDGRERKGLTGVREKRARDGGNGQSEWAEGKQEGKDRITARKSESKGHRKEPFEQDRKLGTARERRVSASVEGTTEGASISAPRAELGPGRQKLGKGARGGTRRAEVERVG